MTHQKTHQDTGNVSKPRAAYGTGSVHAVTKNGKQQFCAQLSITTNGKRSYVRGYGPTPAAAITARTKALQRRYEKGPATQPRGVKISEALERWLEPRGQKLSEQSRRKYRADLHHHVIAHIGDRHLKTLTPNELTQLFHTTHIQRETGASASYHTFTNLNSLLNWCVKQKYLTENPLAQVERPRKTNAVQSDDIAFINKRTRLYTSLLKRLHKEADPQTYLTFYLLTLGFRRSELLGLEWKNLTGLTRKGQAKLIIQQQLKRYEKHEEGTGYYIDHQTKTGRNRTIYLPDDYRLPLLQHQRTQAPASAPQWADLVLRDSKGKNLSYKGLQDLWRNTWKDYLGENYERDAFRLHYTRHIAASVLLHDTGGDLTLTQNILGHSTSFMTLHYSHIMKEAQKKAGRSLGQRFAPTN